ncbi:hypothetical protein KJY78_05555 [Canibacter sp. lx-45]|uniref:hypothetical protein n=1 Tax=Canibacter zhuwentaonis TaxID=2837491 RepID=UPI001BDBE3E2|nr:hypothetical protein [Canibacter zhuwentaonis]MBT1035809.1 hypothetical protein [Canibacter zhuwentaonis]
MTLLEAGVFEEAADAPGARHCPARSQQTSEDASNNRQLVFSGSSKPLGRR